MRLIYSFHDPREGQKFSNYLSSIDIDNQIEMIVNNDWGSEDYALALCRVWIKEEDQLSDAVYWLERFKENPNAEEFAKVTDANLTSLAPPPPEVESIVSKQKEEKNTAPPPREQKMGVVTLYTLVLCSILFVVCNLTMPKITEIPQGIDPSPLLRSPISKALLFDWPKAYTIIDDAIDTYGIDSFSDPAAMPPEEKQMIVKYKQTPYWQGIYDKVVFHLKNPNASWNFNAPLFEKIQQGEVWRLFTPCLLHLDIFHIFFNMVWLIVLGRQIEARLGISRYIIFIIITGIVSNIAQYLMSGPNFIGFSGVVCAMIVFIWVRQKKAPWEGYLLHPSTVMFVSFFVFAILGIQLFSFLMEINGMRPLAPAIANTAHLVGGFAGYLLGKTRIFAWK